MTTCSECQKDISSQAEICPNCGAKTKTKLPLNAIFGAVFTLLVLGYCSSIRTPAPVAPQPITTAELGAPSCTAANFTITKQHATYDSYGYAHLTGVVRHNCPTAAGVRLKWTALNADGTVAFSDDFFPASTTNIPPNTDFAFETMNHAPQGKWTYQIEPIAVQVW
jgi:hypothetical protein